MTISINDTQFKWQWAKMTLSINNTQHNIGLPLWWMPLCWLSRFIDCYAECRVLFIVMLNVIMLNVVIKSVVMLSIIMLSDVILNVLAPGRTRLSSCDIEIFQFDLILFIFVFQLWTRKKKKTYARIFFHNCTKIKLEMFNVVST